MTDKPSLEEAGAFWKEHVQPYTERLLTGSYEMVPVQQHFMHNAKNMFERYKQSFLIQPYNSVVRIPGYKPGSNCIACIIENGRPIIAYFIPDLMVVMNKLQLMTEDVEFVRQLFESYIVIGTMHETDHLANGWAGAASDYERSIEFERLAHAATCEHTVRHFADIRKPVLTDTALRYRLWVECGRNADHPDWVADIRRRYPKR
jgi:hypothetical protein